MTPLSVGRRSLGFVAVLIAAGAIVSSGCGRAADVSATGSPQAKVTRAGLDVAGKLLVVRKDGTAWRVFRTTVNTEAEEALGILPFRPRQAVASLNEARVLYVGAGRRLAVVDSSSGAVRVISTDGYPIRSIDGVTWASDEEVVFGGSRTSWGSPESSSLYVADVATGAVSAMGREGGEPSVSSDAGSLIYVTRRPSARGPYGQSAGSWVRETIHLLTSLDDRTPQSLCGSVFYPDAGREFDCPLLSPDGRYVWNSTTGTDVRVTYQLIDVAFPEGGAYLQISGASIPAATWGDTRVAFQETEASASGGALAVFVYDAATGTLSRQRTPGGIMISHLDWSTAGDLLAGSAWEPAAVYVASNYGSSRWVKVTTGLLPVWVQ